MQSAGYERQAAYRRRKRARRVLVAIEVGPAQVWALQSLELLAEGPFSKPDLAAAVERFLRCAPAISDIPRSLYP